MSWIFDVIVVLIIIGFVIHDFKRGFVAVLLGCLGIFLAMAIAFFVSTPISNALYKNLVEPSVTQKVSSVVESYGEQTDNAVDALFSKGGESLGLIANVVGISADSVKAQIHDTNVSETATDYICNSIIKPPVTDFLRITAMVIIFIAVVLLAKLLKKPFGKATRKMKVIGPINGFLGGVLGVVRGVLVALIVLGVLYLILMLSGGFWGVTTQSIKDTYTLALLYKILPF